MPDDVYSYTVKVKRGDGHDVQKCTVTAADFGTLQERVENVVQLLESKAEDYRAIQPADGRSLADDQGTLTEASQP